MSDAVREEDYKGVRIKIITDQDAESPRDWSPICKMVCFHRRYTLGDKHDFSEPQEFIDWLNKNESEIALVMPLYLFDHSGITISTTPFNDRWDSMRLGYVYVTKEAFDKAIGDGWKRSDGTEVTPESLIDGEVKTYDQYLRGDVYGFTATYIKHDADGDEYEGEELDASTWGLYGQDYAVEYAKEAIDAELEYAAKQQAELDKVITYEI